MCSFQLLPIPRRGKPSVDSFWFWSQRLHSSWSEERTLPLPPFLFFFGLCLPSLSSITHWLQAANMTEIDPRGQSYLFLSASRTGAVGLLVSLLYLSSINLHIFFKRLEGDKITWPGAKFGLSPSPRQTYPTRFFFCRGHFFFSDINPTPSSAPCCGGWQRREKNPLVVGAVAVEESEGGRNRREAEAGKTQTPEKGRPSWPLASSPSFWFQDSWEGGREEGRKGHYSLSTATDKEDPERGKREVLSALCALDEMLWLRSRPMHLLTVTEALLPLFPPSPTQEALVARLMSPGSGDCGALVALHAQITLLSLLLTLVGVLFFLPPSPTRVHTS